MKASTRWLLTGPLFLSIGGAFVACSGADDGTVNLPTTPSASNSHDAGETKDSGPWTTTPDDAGDEDDSSDDGGRPVLAIPKLDAVDLRCKLLNNKGTGDPTPNDVQHRANVSGADLGITVAHGNDFYIFFGDTVGWSGIWGNESHPDAVGYSGVPYADVKADASVLCNNLKILLSEFKTGSADKDFAGGNMKAPEGEDIGKYIKNPSGARGKNAFPTLPGDFEVPSGALSYDGAIYLYYTTVDSWQTQNMVGSYIAKWTNPSTGGKPNYDILHVVDERVDDKGALGGDFVNISPVVVDDYLYLYGTGKYRQSGVNVARKPVAQIEQEGGYERYDALTKQWVAPKVKGSPIVAGGGIGELSVRYYDNVGRFVMLNQEINANGNQIVARFATEPEGPWSDPVKVMSMSDPDFDANYRCPAKNNCAGAKQIIFDYGFYGTYLFPEATKNDDGSFSVDFLMSVFEPYNTVLMRAKFY